VIFFKEIADFFRIFFFLLNLKFKKKIDFHTIFLEKRLQKEEEEEE